MCIPSVSEQCTVVVNVVSVDDAKDARTKQTVFKEASVR